MIKSRSAQKGFSKEQLKRLCRPLNPQHVRTRSVDGRSLSYLDGWYVIARANELFGYAGWHRETVHFERVFERAKSEGTTCGYVARVRVTVSAGAASVVREGTGWGWASSAVTGVAHERAIKSAEIDATKRAFYTFGPQFGLDLYKQEATAGRPRLTLHASDGSIIDDGLSAEGFSTGLRQLVEGCGHIDDLEKLIGYNSYQVTQMKLVRPDLCNSEGVHFAELLELIFKAARRRIAGSSQRLTHEPITQPIVPEIDAPPTPDQTPSFCGTSNACVVEMPGDPSAASEAGMLETEVLAQPSRIGPGSRVDKSQLKLGNEKRIRDKDHLRRVAQLPCVICSRQPSHAHHLRFAQRRGLSQKVSDEYVVPLCAIHHGGLHQSANELDWWAKQSVAPLEIAAKLWGERNVLGSNMG